MISFAITTHNEGEYIKTLLDQLVPYCEETGDEIVVLDDYSTDEYTCSILEAYSSNNSIKLFTKKLDGNFAEHKNYLNKHCSGEYIFQVDADETLHPTLLKYLQDIVFRNTDVDLFLIPRINTVTGLTQEDIQRWRWQVNEKGWVMFPDYQTRIYRNEPDRIKWEGKVHERITGHKTQVTLPAEEDWCLYHEKDIARQRAQNDLYEKL